VNGVIQILNNFITPISTVSLKIGTIEHTVYTTLGILMVIVAQNGMIFPGLTVASLWAVAMPWA
jgi:hypothetical protein